MAKMKDSKEKGSLHDGTKRQKDLLKENRDKFKAAHPHSKGARPIVIQEQVM